MSTIYTKLKDELITPEEAAAAQEAYELPSNFFFEHWSSSETEDIEVTELNDGGEGIKVTSNGFYYPVISTEELTSERFYAEHTINGEQAYVVSFESYINLSSSAGSFSSRTDEGFAYTTGTEYNYLHFAAAVRHRGSQQITGYLWNYEDYVDFGMIDLTKVRTAGAKSYTRISEYTGRTYYLKVTANEERNDRIYDIVVRAYVLEDGNIKQMGQLLAETDNKKNVYWNDVGRLYDTLD